jgi:hypothetical protein
VSIISLEDALPLGAKMQIIWNFCCTEHGLMEASFYVTTKEMKAAEDLETREATNRMANLETSYCVASPNEAILGSDECSPSNYSKASC